MAEGYSRASFEESQNDIEKAKENGSSGELESAEQKRDHLLDVARDEAVDLDNQRDKILARRVEAIKSLDEAETALDNFNRENTLYNMDSPESLPLRQSLALPELVNLLSHMDHIRDWERPTRKAAILMKELKMPEEMIITACKDALKKILDDDFSVDRRYIVNDVEAIMEFFKKTGLDLSEFEEVVTNDVVELLKTDDPKHELTSTASKIAEILGMSEVVQKSPEVQDLIKGIIVKINSGAEGDLAKATKLASDETLRSPEIAEVVDKIISNQLSVGYLSGAFWKKHVFRVPDELFYAPENKQAVLSFLAERADHGARNFAYSHSQDHGDQEKTNLRIAASVEPFGISKEDFDAMDNRRKEAIKQKNIKNGTRYEFFS